MSREDCSSCIWYKTADMTTFKHLPCNKIRHITTNLEILPTFYFLPGFAHVALTNPVVYFRWLWHHVSPISKYHGVLPRTCCHDTSNAQAMEAISQPMGVSSTLPDKTLHPTCVGSWNGLQRPIESPWIHGGLDVPRVYGHWISWISYVETCWSVERTLQYCKATRVKSDYLTQTMLLSQIFHQTMCWNQFLKTSRLLGCAFRFVRPPTMIISPVTSKAKHSSSQTGWFQTITIDKTQSMRQFCLDPFGVKHSGMPKLHAIRFNPQHQQPLVGSFRFVWKYCALNLDALICHQLMESHIFRLSPLDVPENGPYTPKNYQFKKKMVINHQIWGLSHFWAPFFVSFLEPQTSQTSQTTKRLFPMVKKNATHQMVETCWN